MDWNETEEVDPDESIAMLAEIYYIYMLMCIVIGLTGNSMVWVLIRFAIILLVGLVW